MGAGFRGLQNCSSVIGDTQQSALSHSVIGVSYRSSVSAKILHSLSSQQSAVSECDGGHRCDISQSVIGVREDTQQSLSTHTHTHIRACACVVRVRVRYACMRVRVRDACARVHTRLVFVRVCVLIRACGKAKNLVNFW